MLSKYTNNDSHILLHSETYEKSKGKCSKRKSGLLQEGFLAKIFPSLVKALGWLANDLAYGLNMRASLASYDRDTQSWKTSELSLFGGLMPFSGRFPKSGMMRNGKIYALRMWERPINGKESGLWRTPAAHDPGVKAEMLIPIEGGEPGGMNRHFDKHTGRMAQIGLTQQVKLREIYPTPSASMMTIQDMEQARFAGNDPKRPKYQYAWPTPTVNDSKNSLTNSQKRRRTLTAKLVERLLPTPKAQNARGSGERHGDGGPSLDVVVGGQLNPTWVEWLMGYPLGWTDLSVLGIALSLKSQS
jgi:hypothetical protein